MKQNKVGRIPVRGKVLRLNFDGGSVDIELMDSDDTSCASVEKTAKSALADLALHPIEAQVMRPRQIRGVPIL